MSRTESSLQSEFSGSTFSTFANSDQFVNFQQKFSHFNPETPNPHYNEFDQSESHSSYKHGYTEENGDQNQNSYALFPRLTHSEMTSNEQVSAPDLNLNSFITKPTPIQSHPCDKKHNFCATTLPCNCNIHVHYNISYSSPIPVCACHSAGFYSELLQGRGLHPPGDGDRYVCDV